MEVLAGNTSPREKSEKNRVETRRFFSDRRGRPLGLRGVFRVQIYKHVLVAVDGSTFSARAIERGGTLAVQLGAKLSLINVLAVDPAQSLPDSYWEAGQNEQAKILTEAVALVAKLGAQAETVAAEGNVDTEILAKCASLGCDLLVVGSHGHGGVRNFVLGSVSQRLANTSTVDFLIVR